MKHANSVSTLSKAIIVGDLKIIKKLLIKGKLPQATDNRGWTAIHYCVSLNRVKALKLILKTKARQKEYLVNLSTWENVTPLLLALNHKSPSLEIVKLLLDAGADPQLSTPTKLSPLHSACLKKGNIEFVKLLVQYGANVNAQEDILNFTPLHFAITKSCDLEIIEYLIKICDLSILNISNRTAFLEACNFNLVEVVKIFLQFDKNLANINDDIPPLAYAGILGNLEMVNILLESGANVNLRCKALVPDMSDDSEVIVLDVKNYLPVHSCLKNLEIFELLLRLTNSSEIETANANFCDFSLFVLVFAKDNSFFEAVMQSNLPEELKKIKCRSIINFVLACTWEKNLLIRKFRCCFKYNFYLEPEDVFQFFLCILSNEEIIENLKFLHQLAVMGVASGDQYFYKMSAIRILENSVGKDDLAKEVCHLLSQTVLSLKQLSRIIARRQIKSFAKTDWQAYRMVKESGLPNCLKKFLLFEV